MPLRIALPQQTTVPSLIGAPRASAPSQPDYIGQAMQGVAAELQGMVRDQQIYDKEIKKAQQEADLTDRLGRATSDLADLELQMERDPDFKTAPQRFTDQANTIRDKYLTDVQDSGVKLAFTKRFGELSLAKSLTVRKAAFTQERDYNVASLDTSLDVHAKAIAGARSAPERELLMNQARLSISSMQAANWITDVDAGKRERALLTKIDDAIVVRDMATDPLMVASKLGIDPSYAPNIDPVQRERWIDQAYRRAETTRTQAEQSAERDRKKRGDEAAKDIWGRLADGKLTRDYLDQNRALLDPPEYRQMLESIKKQGKGSGEDNHAAFADLQARLYSDPEDARQLAFSYHKRGLIKDSTLSQVLGNARDLSRTQGPKTVYERTRQFVTNSLEPSAMTADPAPRARQGLAIKEYDDFASSGKRTDAELETKAKDVIRTYSLVDMNELARKTGLSAQNDPARMLEQITQKGQKLQADLTAGRIKQAEFDKQMADLNRSRIAAEKANGRK